HPETVEECTPSSIKAAQPECGKGHARPVEALEIRRGRREMKMTAGRENPMHFFEHRWQMRDMLQHAIRKNGAVRTVRLRNGVPITLNQLVIRAELARALELACIRIDAGVNALGEHHVREQSFAAAEIKNRARERYARIDPRFEHSFESERARRKADVFPDDVIPEFQESCCAGCVRRSVLAP